MTTFTTEDKERAYKQMLEEAPRHVGYEDAIINVEPIPFAGLVNLEHNKSVDKEEEMTWNLRLVSMEDEDFPEEPYVEIREVYYNQLGKPLGHCLAAMGGKDVAEIKQYLLWAIEALDKPVVTFGE